MLLSGGFSEHRFLLGDNMTLIDVAWFVYVGRLLLIGYPMSRLHPRLNLWFARLSEAEPFAGGREISNQLLGHIGALRARGQLETFGSMILLCIRVNQWRIHSRPGKKVECLT